MSRRSLIDILLRRQPHDTEAVSGEGQRPADRYGMRKARYSEPLTQPTADQRGSSQRRRRRPSRADVRAPTAHAFMVTGNGPRLASIRELRDALRSLDEEQVTFHLHDHGNDFAAWVRDVFGERSCADMMERCRDRNELVGVLDRFCARCGDR